MSFFYDLNKKLDGIRATPEVTHKQLNERDMSRAAKGYEKYGKEGMEALAKAGREGKALDPVRAKYDKYDNTEVDEGFGDMARNVGGAIKRGAKKVLDVVAPGDEALLKDLQKQVGVPQTGKKPTSISFHKSNTVDDNAVTGKVKEEGGAPMSAKQKSFAALAPPTDKITFADKIAGAKKEVDEMLGDVAAEAMKSALGGGRGRNSKMDETQGATTYTVAYKDPKKPGKSYSTQVKATSAAEAKAAFQDWDETGRFTYLGSRPDVDKVHEASADNAFTAHKRPRAETPKVGTITHGSKHDVEEIPGGRRVTRRTDAQGISVGADDDKPADGEKRGRGRPKGPAKAPERVTGGATKHKGGRKTNEGSDYGQAQQIYDDLADVRAVAKQAQRGGEFPQGFASRLESVLYAAMTLIKNQQAGSAQVSEEELDEKAVSKKQQKFMGMVHAAQKGEKPASGAVAKVAKDMGKKDVKDFAATKHKGLPEKKKPEAKDKKKEVEETSDNTPGKSSGGFKFGGGIYDSINRDLENMIAESMSRLDESMSINMSMNNDEHGGPTRSLTVTATDDDAMKLSQLLKSAGLGGGDEGYGGGGYKPACGCGTPDCSCGEQQMHEVSMNQPDYPTNTETSSDALQYSGGLNKPKSTGQTTVPVIASQEERQYTQEGSDYDELTDKIQWLMGAPNYLKPDEAREAAAYTPDTDSIWDGYRDDTNEDAVARMMEMAGRPMTNHGQLDEGMMDKLKGLVVPKLMKLLGPDAVDIANAVKQATGGDLSPTKENAMRVVQALGIDKAAEQGQSPQMAEGIAGNWQGKLRQALYTVGLLGSTGAFAAMTGTPALIMGAIGVALLMMANAVFGSGPGSVGVMGKFGNKGTSTQRGLDIHGSPITNTNVDESDDLSRMMEMAGVKKKAVDEEKTEEGNLFTKGLADDNIKVGDKIPGTDAVKKKDIDESIFAMTANLWKTYKG